MDGMDLDRSLQELAGRAFTATLHRLRGVRGLLHGWAQVGVPQQDIDQLEDRFGEDLNLLARLDWLHALVANNLPLERVEGGEAPVVLLAAALGYGTPDEPRGRQDHRLPQAAQPAGALSLALWLHEAVEPSTLDRLQWRLEGGQLRVEHPQTRARDFGPWHTRYGNLLAEGSEVASGRLLYRRGVFQAQTLDQGA